MDTVHATEIWRPIPDWPYEASSLGRVRRAAPGSSTHVGHVLKPCYAGFGYGAVCLSRNGEVRRFYLHELVCTAFHGPKPSPEMEVRHLDGTVDNDVPSNLAWGTHGENMRDKWRHGTMPAGEKNGRCIISDADTQVIRAEYAEVCGGKCRAPGGWQAAAAARYGVRPATISLIVSRTKGRGLRLARAAQEA